MEHAVILHIRLSDEFGDDDERESVRELEDKLGAAIDCASVGEFDGDEFGGGECVIYCYGSNADRLFAAIDPVIRSHGLPLGGHAVKRYGDVSDLSAREVRVEY